MSYTDPSGYFFDKLFKGINKALGKFAPFVAAALMFIPGVGQWAAASMWNAAAVGFVSGGIATGSLKGALIGAFTGAAFHQIGSHFNNLHGDNLRAAIGGSSDKLYNFGGNLLTSGQVAGQIASHAVVGGVISTLSGGKFANGAFSAAFAAALRANWGGNKLSDGQAKGELTEQETVALDKDLVDLNKKIRSLKSFANKADALKWAHKNIHSLSVNHDVEIGVNIFDDIGNVRLGNAVTDYYRHEISAATLLTSSIKGWEKGWVASWHSHAAGESGGFSYPDHELYSSWSQSNPNLTFHMSRINLNGSNQLDTYIGEYYVQRF